MNSPYKVHKLDFDANSVFERLLELKPYWELRSPDVGFYTLGKSSYIEGRTPAYKEEKDRLNALLASNFQDLYISMLTKLTDIMKEPVLLSTELAIPGFHIFEVDERMEGQAGNWHTDYPHITLGLDGTDHSTVTVAVKLPQSGAGLDWIDQEGEHYLPYAENDMIMHDGTNLHRIAGPKDIVPGEYRVTLQGHIIRRDNGLEIYW